MLWGPVSLVTFETEQKDKKKKTTIKKRLNDENNAAYLTNVIMIHY